MVDRKSDDGLSPDDVFEILSNARRRFMIDYLHQQGGSQSLSDIADHIASREYETPVDQIGNDQRRRVYISLYQTHLPKLVEYGVVEYDEDEKSVSLTRRVADVDRFLYINNEGPGRWWVLYVVLTAVAAGLLAGTWLDWYPFAMLSEELLVLLVAAAFITLSAAHYAAVRFGRRHRRLGGN